MKRKNLLALMGSICLILVLVALLLPACAKEVPAPAPAPTPAPAVPAPAPVKPAAPAKPAWTPPECIGLASHEVGTSGYAAAVALAPLMEKSLGVPVRIMPSHSMSVQFTQILTGKAHFVQPLSQGNIGDALLGNAQFADHAWGPQTVGMLAYNYLCPFGLVVRGNSDIKTMADLKGKKAASYVGNPSWSDGFDGCLAFAGLTRDDIQVVEVGSYTACARAVAEGKVDFAYNSPISTVSYEIAGSAQGTRYLPMPLDDKEGWDRFHEVALFLTQRTCDLGVEHAHGVPMANTDFVVGTYRDIDEELIYRIVKFICEEHDSFKDLHPNLAFTGLEDTLKFKDKGIAIPIVPGTVRYLKEIGQWDNADEQWNNEQWDRVGKLQKAWEEALDEALPQKIRPQLDNEAWLEIWHKHRANVPPPLPR